MHLYGEGYEDWARGGRAKTALLMRWSKISPGAAINSKSREREERNWLAVLDDEDRYRRPEADTTKTVIKTYKLNGGRETSHFFIAATLRCGGAEVDSRAGPAADPVVNASAPPPPPPNTRTKKHTPTSTHPRKPHRPHHTQNKNKNPQEKNTKKKKNIPKNTKKKSQKTPPPPPPPTPPPPPHGN